MDKCFQHPEPAWRDSANFILLLQVGDGDTEQVWAKVAGPDRYILCCIPFFVEGLSLGDEFEEHADGIFKIVRRSGRWVIRVWVKSPKLIGDRLVQIIEGMGLLTETRGRLIAIDIPDAVLGAGLAAKLDPLEAEGLIEYEVANGPLAG